MTETPNNNLQSLSNFVKPIFLKWEKLRLPYNLILAAILLLSQGGNLSTILVLAQSVMLVFWIVGAVLANLCFLAGPLVEAYLTWLGVESRWLTPGLFGLGLLISIPLVLLFPLPFALWTMG
jgi:hypothetical protein